MQPFAEPCNTRRVDDRSGRWYARWWAILIILGLVLGATAFVTTKALGLRSVVVDAQPFPQPPEGFDTEWWNGALARWVREDRVDYARVLEDAHDLKRFAATLAVVGPTATPERFQTEDERLAYYINAYNALTLLGVVENWPISSVHDVRGWLNPRAGFGFFYGLRFPLDGGEINLYDLENDLIRGFRDARIHAAINCASNSCPPLAPFAYDAVALDGQPPAGRVQRHGVAGAADEEPVIGREEPGLLVQRVLDAGRQVGELRGVLDVMPWHAAPPRGE